MQSGKKKAFIIVSLAVAALLLALVVRPAKVDKWAAMTNRVDQLKIDARSRKLPRSILQGKLIPGNAWDEYNIALKDAQTWRDGDNGGSYVLFANGAPHVDRARIERLVAEHAKALDHLRLGARADDGQYPYDWKRGRQMALPSLLGCRRLGSLAIAQARILTENGRAQDAVDLLLDVTVFARDLSTNGTLLSTLIGYAIYSTTSDGLRNLLLSGKLSQKQLEDLAKKMEIVDHDFPTLSSTLSNETMLFGVALLQEASAPLWERLKSGGWGFAVAPRAMVLNTIETKEGYLERSRKLDLLNFEAAKKEAEAITTEERASPNPIVRLSMPDLSKVLTVHRETLAHLRLLRAGTIYLATGAMPTLADPFGQHLFTRQESGRAKVWSIGSDGKNQNGVGTWEGKPDIVFEIPK